LRTPWFKVCYQSYLFKTYWKAKSKRLKAKSCKPGESTGITGYRHRGFKL